MVLTANGEVHTIEEAQEYVHDLILFVTMQLLEETPPVQPLEKLCEDHRYAYEWVSGQKPRLTNEDKTITCKTDNFEPLVVPWLSTNSGSNSSSTSTLQDLSPTSPARERTAGLAPGDRCGSSPKPKTKRKKKDSNRESDDRLRDLPAWLEEFADNPEDTEVPAPAHISQDSDSERPTKVASKKGSTVFILTSERPKIAKYACEQKHKGFFQTTHWRSSTSSRKFW